MVIKTKRFYVNSKSCKVELKKEGADYLVVVDGNVYDIRQDLRGGSHLQLFAVSCAGKSVFCLRTGPLHDEAGKI